jgi:hypothetical protein
MSDLFTQLKEQLSARHQRVMKNVDRGVRALITADRNGDGKLNADDQLDAIDNGLVSDEFLKTMKRLDCKRDAAVISVIAAEISTSIKRSLDVLNGAGAV